MSSLYAKLYPPKKFPSFAPRESRQQFVNRRLFYLREESKRSWLTFQELLEFFRYAGEMYDKGERA